MREGWQVLPLGVLCDVLDHKRKPITKRDREAGEYPYYGATGVLDHVAGFLFDEPLVLVGEDGAKWGSGENTAFAVEGRVWVNNHAHVLRPNRDKLLDRWLIYHLNHSDLSAFVSGLTVPKLNQGSLREIPVPVPPLPEQQRIVALLDEAFAGLATAKANAERNIQNARAIFESHLQSVFSQRGEGWEEKRLEEVCGLQNGFAFKSSTFKPCGVPILRISNIQDGRIDSANRIVFFDPSDYRENLDRYRILEGDLLIAMSGATTGKLGFNTESKVYYLNQRVGKFEPTKRLDKRFLYHFLSTKVEESLRISAGTAQPNLSTEQIKGFVLPLPSVDEQERIVDVLETLSKETQRLTRLYERKLAALEELKKSLLHQAFNGEL
jgi:type I restriction enzyme S subunit